MFILINWQVRTFATGRINKLYIHKHRDIEVGEMSCFVGYYTYFSIRMHLMNFAIQQENC